MVVTVATDTADIDAFFAAIESPVTEATAAAVVQHTEQATDMLPVSALPADIVPQVELALYNRAIGTSAWKEQLDRDGVPVKVCYEVPPDVAAAKALLAAHAPERYGTQAQPMQSAVIVNLIGVDRAKHVSVARIASVDVIDVVMQQDGVELSQNQPDGTLLDGPAG